MIICHPSEKIYQAQNIKGLKCNSILTDGFITISTTSFIFQSGFKLDKLFPIFLSIQKHKQYRGGSDKSAQTKQYYSFNTQCFDTAGLFYIFHRYFHC